MKSCVLIIQIHEFPRSEVSHYERKSSQPAKLAPVSQAGTARAANQAVYEPDAKPELAMHPIINQPDPIVTAIKGCIDYNVFSLRPSQLLPQLLLQFVWISTPKLFDSEHPICASALLGLFMLSDDSLLVISVSQSVNQLVSQLFMLTYVWDNRRTPRCVWTGNA